MNDATQFKKFGFFSILLILILICLTIFIAWGIYKAAFPPVPPLQGEMEARVISIASRVPARIAKVYVKEGENVRKGQPIVELALPVLEAKLAQLQAQESAAEARQSMVDAGPRKEQIVMAKSQWEKAMAEAELAKKTWERLDALFHQGLISSERHDQARAQLVAGEQTVRAAKEEYDLVLAGARIQEKEVAAEQTEEARAGIREVEALTENHILMSPRDGQVDKILLVEGEILVPGFPAATVIDLREQWVSFNLLEKYLPGMQIGRELSAKIPAINRNDVKFEVYYISPRANYATWRSTREDSGYDMKTFEIRARPRETVPDLRPGMSVLVKW